MNLNNKPLPLHPGASPCVQCGYCCKVRPCAFGVWNERKKQCDYLKADNTCAIYHVILARDIRDWWLNPAFGAGSCAPFNSDRLALLRARARAAGPVLQPDGADHEPGQPVAGDK